MFDAEMMLFSGTSNRKLAEEIAVYLKTNLSPMEISNFADGEIFLKILINVRGADAFVIQPTCPPVNDNLMELLLIIDALKRASARRITAVIPYYGYARQDRKTEPRVPISAKMVADLITVAGADRVLVIDLHVGQIQGFFDIPVDQIKHCINNRKFAELSYDNRLSKIHHTEFFSMYHLAKNAAEHSNRYWIEIGSNDKYNYITVRDDGCGIKEKNLKEIFGEFSTTGKGLGLQIVKDIIHFRGGYVEVKTKTSKGSWRYDTREGTTVEKLDENMNKTAFIKGVLHHRKLFIKFCQQILV